MPRQGQRFGWLDIGLTLRRAGGRGVGGGEAAMVGPRQGQLSPSVEVAEITPAATLVIWRSAPAAPTDTTEEAAEPATFEPEMLVGPVWGAEAVELLPSTTAPLRPAATVTLLPMTKALLAAMVLLLPIE